MSIILDTQKMSFILKFHVQNTFQFNGIKSIPFEPLNCCAALIATFLLYEDHSLLAFIPSVFTSKDPQNILNHLSFLGQHHFVPLIFTKQKST